MNVVINQTLIMTAIGMGLVFVGVLLLWLLMELLVRLFKDKEEVGEEVAPSEAIEETVTSGLKQKAAAVAVAVALAQPSRASNPEFAAPAGNQYSNWQTVQRSLARQQSQLSNRNSRGNTR